MKKISYLLIAIGILIILFPKANEWMEDTKQRNLLKNAELERAADSENTGQTNPGLQNEYSVMSQILDASASDESEDEDVHETIENQTQSTGISVNPVKNNKNEEDQRAIAVIKISKIDLKLPVLEGATKSNMKYAAAHLKETAGLGQDGNAAIAAHRARTKGRLFNRLNEIEIGDEIVVEVKEDKFVYKVDKISVVEPTDISVLDSDNPEEKVLTLITCDPLVNPTHRLIVRAKM